MRQHLAEGLAAAEAAALVTSPAATDEAARHAFEPAAARRELADALESFDEPRAQTVVDRLFATATVDVLLADVFLPYLHELGERWERGEASVAQEHFASAVLRGRLLGLARGWGRGLGPLALLACLPGEQHELGLIAFGLALRSRGWRIAYLGSDTPLDTVGAAARSLAPSIVVLSAVTEDHVRSAAAELQELAKEHRLAIGGAGTDGAAALGALPLAGDPVAAAEHVSRLLADAARA
jgi:methanogenic corrinoid protein MtbC1